MSNINRKEFNEITAIAGFNPRNKGLYRYANGRSKLFKEFLAGVKRSHVPVKYRIPMAAMLLDRYANGDIPDNLAKAIYKFENKNFKYDDKYYRDVETSHEWKELVLECPDVIDYWYKSLRLETKDKYRLAVMLLDEQFELV